jgi:hypothetical protein
LYLFSLKYPFRGLFVAFLLFTTSQSALAADLRPVIAPYPQEFKEINQKKASSFKKKLLTEQKGLITVPTARMPPSGTMSLDASNTKAVTNISVAMQMAPALEIKLRQSIIKGAIKPHQNKLQPGVDVALRLIPETQYAPAIALTLQSAVGSRALAYETLVASKRIDRFDISAGMVWGALGKGPKIKNPLSLHNHFDKERKSDIAQTWNYNQPEKPHGPEEWFTGKNAGLFVGLKYDLPFIEGLSLNAEYGAHNFMGALMNAHGKSDNIDPWAAGLSYQPFSGITLGVASLGGKEIMGQINLSAPLSTWWFSSNKNKSPPPLYPTRRYNFDSDITLSQARAATYDYNLTATSVLPHRITTIMDHEPYRPLPQEIGRTARILSQDAGYNVEALEILPMRYGLRGPSVQIMRSDLERAVIWNQGSPQEIWRNTKINMPSPAVSEKDFKPSIRDFAKNFRLQFLNQTSLNEDDHGVITRNAIILETHQNITHNLMTQAGLRLNLLSNISEMHLTRMPHLSPVRSDIAAFTQRTIALDHMFLGYFKTLRDDVHFMAAAGYLEEMYGGAGGEILYRPQNKAWSIGADGWKLLRRDPWSDMAQGFTGENTYTAHLNANYEIPDTNLTIHAKAGRYLGGDLGGTLALRHDFKQGGSIEAFATITDSADLDSFGNLTHIYSGLKLALPIGSAPVVPEGSSVQFDIGQLGRQSGQILNHPAPLYDMTQDFSVRQIARDWNSVIE